MGGTKALPWCVHVSGRWAAIVGSLVIAGENLLVSAKWHAQGVDLVHEVKPFATAVPTATTTPSTSQSTSTGGVRGIRDNGPKAVIDLHIQHAQQLPTDAFDQPPPINPFEVNPANTPLTYGDEDDVRFLPGVKTNRTGDLQAFLCALGVNISAIFMVILAGASLRRRYPKVYYGNYPEVIGKYPEVCPYVPKFWMVDGLRRVAIDDVTTYAGLDQAMMLEFNQLGMRILLIVGVPLICILCPMHFYFGGGRAGDDRLSKLGIANVVQDHPWLYWVHAVVVWLVVGVVGYMVYQAQINFLGRRMAWLKRMPPPRSTTILVERIPEDLRSDQKIKAYFDQWFGREVVEVANVVKFTDTVEDWAFQRDFADRALLQAHTYFEKTGKRSRFTDYLGATHDSVNYWTDRLASVEEELAKEVKMLKAGAEVCMEINSDAGFVTFTRRRDAEVALRMRFNQEVLNMTVSIPPDPADVIYSDYKMGEERQFVHHILGYISMAVLYVAYLPCIVGVVSLLTVSRLSTFLPFMEPLGENTLFTAMWDGMVGSIAMQFFLGLVPSFLALILLAFFHLKAESNLQHMVQIWYGYFLVVFVILITSLGAALFTEELGNIVHQAGDLVTLIAGTVPRTTHFYMNLIPVLWVAHTVDSLRLATLNRYLSFRGLYGEDVAKDMAEPEDQDFHGIGSRAARQTFTVVLCLVMCSLAPLITALGFINCLLCRMVYGYLVAFAEVRKPDTGGLHWASQLKFVLQGLVLYIALMGCVLSQRASTLGPCVVACGSMLLLAWMYRHFESIHWETLSLDEVVTPQPEGCIGQDPALRNSYEQPELSDFEKFAHSKRSATLIGRRLARAVRRGSLAR